MRKNKIIMSALLFLGLLAGCSKKEFDLPPTANNFIQGDLTNSKVDIILMVDNSSSMSQHQSKLASQVGSMVTALNALGLDWHIGTTTSDMSGTGSGGVLSGAGTVADPTYITATTANGVQLLTNKVMAGQNGSDLEQGLDSVQSAINNILDPSPSNPDKGFWRDDAVLAIIFLTDENDWSRVSPVDFQKFMDQVKRPFASGKKAWVANFLGLVQIDPSCTAGGYPAPGIKYMQVADYTGGVKDSICTTSLDKAVQNVKYRILEFLKDFYLPRLPVESSIVVSKNGIVVAKSNDNGWEYIANGNFIRFHGSAIPQSSERINVDYKPAEAL